MHNVSFGYKDIDTWHAIALEKEQGHIYSRNTNPTVRAFEDKVKALENAEAGTSFSCGMAAISNVLMLFYAPEIGLYPLKTAMVEPLQGGILSRKRSNLSRFDSAFFLQQFIMKMVWHPAG